VGRKEKEKRMVGRGDESWERRRRRRRYTEGLDGRGGGDGERKVREFFGREKLMEKVLSWENGGWRERREE